MPSPVAFQRRPLQSVSLIFAISLLYRLVVGIHFLRIGGMAHQWNNEMASVARSLVLRHAFAGAYHGYDGPTAWVAPVYPFLVAAVFALFGLDSKISAVILLLTNIAASSLTVVVIYRLGRSYMTERAGLIAGWAFALSPWGALMPLLLWDTALSAFMLSLSLLILLRASSDRQWAGAGVLWGVAALVSPALLAPLPAILLSRLWRESARLRVGACFGLTLACVLLPWTIRNRVELNAIFPVRSNGWAEIYFGNINFALHPYGSTTGLYQQLGEARFVELLKGETIQYIGSHSGQFVWVSLRRAVRFWFVPFEFLPITLIAALGCWTGMVLQLRKFEWLAVSIASVPIFYPIIFSITHIEARYRHPIEPTIYLLAAYAGCELYDTVARKVTRASRSTRTQQTASSNSRVSRHFHLQANSHL